MFFTYNKTTKKVSLYDETDFKAHNILERQDLEKWVEENPDIVGEELLIITTEYDKFDKTDERLDLLAIDREGNLVVLELKRDDSGKDVELQAIKYAAYCSTLTFDEIIELHRQYLIKKGKTIDSDNIRQRITQFVSDEFEELNDKPRIILVSREYRPEVTASILWLRKFGIDIRCVKLTPYELNKDTIAFESTILIPLPEAEDFIIKSEKKENIEHTLTVTQVEYERFYRELVKKLGTRLPLSFLDPKPKSYYQIPSGISGIHFEWAFHGRPRDSFGVELHFEKSNKDFNQSAISKLEQMRSEIESQMGEQVVFLKQWGSTWSRLFILKNEGAMTDELKNWAVDKMEIFYKILQPNLEKMK
jgi:hypothetical protein